MSILIQVSTQTLLLKNDRDDVIAQYPVSTAKKGMGEHRGSEKTPRGHHLIAEKIGENTPVFTIFRVRQPTNEIFSLKLKKQYPDCDWILSRILWLAGTEEGFNCGNDVDTQSRFIYIHGTNDEAHIGTPNSHGCVRMKNADIIMLFDQVFLGESVIIQ